MAYPDTPPQPAGSGISLGRNAEIMAGAQLPDLNSAGGLAFAARMRGEAADAIAIVCDAHVMPRLDAITAMRSVNNASILRMMESGVVLWPQDEQRHYAFVFQRPTAPRMMQDIRQPLPTMSEDAINQYFISPMIKALNELTRTGLVHHAVRPTNIFWRAGSATPPQLGECLSAPPGFGQPVLFETIERAMSNPRGRGAGSHTDDCYALGVTIAMLILGQTPLAAMEDDAIIQTKIDRGTFNALVGNKRLPAGHIELLRGLLNDDGRQRWTPADMEHWIQGRRTTPKNSDINRRAGRHIEFNGKEYWQVRPLAAALAADIPAAMQLIESGTLDKWMRRALGDEERAANLEEARRSLKENSKLPHFEDQLIARACISLDPQGPIRYRGLAVMPAGITDMLSDAILTGGNLQALSEIITSQLVTFWVEMQKDVKAELVPLAQQYERMRGMLDRTGLGYGIERVIYELNPAMPCLSPIVRSQYVTSSKALLPALERVALSGGRPAEPMDRHIAAFLAMHDRRGDLLFTSITSADPARRGAGLVSLYSDMQNRHGPDTLPGLAQWLLPLIESTVQRYLGKALREKKQAQLRDTAARGNLALLSRLIDDTNQIEEDQQQFRAARMLYLNTLKEIAHLESLLSNRDMVLKRTGKPVAASLSGYLAIILIMVAILRAVLQYILGA